MIPGWSRTDDPKHRLLYHDKEGSIQLLDHVRCINIQDMIIGKIYRNVGQFIIFCTITNEYFPSEYERWYIFKK